MAARVDRDRRSTRVAGAILAGLFLLVVGANLLWPGPPPAEPDQARMPSTSSPFPVFRMAPVLNVTTLDPDANLSLRLLMTSLQGLANRDEVSLYLDVSGVAGNTSAMLSYIASRYNVPHRNLSTQAAIDAYAPRTAGLVVYDPSRPESIDIGTVLAGQWNATLVGPDLAGWMHARYGLPVLLDYGQSDWASLDAIGAYDRALRELYPSTRATLLSILPADRWAIRDYLIATKTFVFYLTQGALASPFEVAETERILRAAPRGIPILGWFATPTLTEENAFVQMSSAEGKFVVGVQDVPNLSVLTALGRSEAHRQSSSSRGATPTLEDKTYVVLAVPDGDNVDFAASRMMELWSEPVRGTMPMAWSLNPLLVDLAPPLLDRYYDTASSLDRFIAAPSGAGYLYPDYSGPGDLPSFAAFSKRYLAAADMDVVWLLNAFTASEIPYSSASLSTYVDGLRPGGIVLDYDDQPRTRDAWMQAGASLVAPVIRSTHFWTTAENVQGKLDAAVANWGGGPHFLWLTIYTFRFDLHDAKALVDGLSARLAGDVEVVSPSDFFDLLRQDFIRSARTHLEAMSSDPIASLLFPSSLDSARQRLQDADAFLAAGDSNRAAFSAYLGLEELRAASAAEALFLSLLVVLLAGVLAFVAHRSPRSREVPSDPLHLGVLLAVTASTALLVFALRESLDQNFWTYPTILVGIAVAGAYRPLRRILDRAYPEHAPLAAALVDLVFTDLAIRTSVAFPLAVIGSLLVLEAYLARRPGGSMDVVAGFAFGSALGFLGGFDLPTFSALAILLVASAFGVRGPPISDGLGRRPRALLPGFILALPLSALAVAFYYSFALRLDFQGDLLLTAAGSLLVLGPTLAILLDRAFPSASAISSETAGLTLAAVFGGIVLLVQGPIPTVLALLGLVSALSYAALKALERFAARGGDPRRALATAVLFLPLFVLFFRMPPIVYSLVIVPLPELIEYALYAPAVVIAATALVLAALVGLRGRVRVGVGKDYPGEPHRGAGGR